MATVGSIVVNLVAKTAAFRNSMKKSQRTLKSFGAGVLSIGKKVAQFGVIAGTIAVAGLVAMTKASMAAIDATVKLADALGLTVQELTAYQHIAGLSGVSSNDVGTAFKRMQKNISDATLGLTTANRAFDSMGLSAEDLKRKSPGEQFKDIADAFQTIPTQADKARVAMDLFGRSGLGMIKIMELGGAGIDALAKEADRLGITFGRKAAAKVEAANDAMLRMKSIFTGLGNQIAIHIAPLIVALSNKFTQLAIDGGGVGPLVVKGFRMATMAVGFLGDAWQVVTIAANVFRVGVLNAITTVLTGIKHILIAFSVLHPEFGKLTLEWAKSADAFAKGTRAVAAELRTDIEDTWNQPWAHDRILKSFDELQRKADKSAAATAKSRADALVTDASITPAVAGTSSTVTQFNKNLVSFSAGASKKGGIKGDPEQTQLLATIALNTSSPVSVLSK